MWFFALIVVLLIGAVAVVASGRWGAMAQSYDDRPDTLVPARHALTADDIESSRFAIGVRGYRMDEVDTLLERVAREVAERDRRIADLERAVTPIVRGPEGDGFAPRDDRSAAGAPAATGPRPDDTGPNDQHEGESTPAGLTDAGTTQAGTTQPGTTQAGTTRGESAQGGTAQHGTESGRSAQGGTEQDPTEQGATAEGATERGATALEEEAGPSQVPAADGSAVRPQNR